MGNRIYIQSTLTLEAFNLSNRFIAPATLSVRVVLKNQTLLGEIILSSDDGLHLMTLRALLSECFSLYIYQDFTI